MSGSDWGVFIGLSLILIGGASFMAGRAIADNWRPFWLVVPAAFGLALADRFLSYALFWRQLLDPTAFVVHFVIFLLLGLLGWRLTRVAKLCRQYPWRFRRTTPWGYAQVTGGGQ